MCATGVLLAVVTDGGSSTIQRDRAVTNRYLAARRVFATHLERSQTERDSAVRAYVAGIASSCAGALRGAPPIMGKPGTVREGNTVALAPRALLFLDAAVGVKQRMQLVETAAISEFTREVRGLRWSDSVLTKLVHAFVDVEDGRLEQEAPKLCRDARAWAGSDYKILAAHTSRTAEGFGGAREVLMHALADGGCNGPYPGRAVLHVLERAASRGERRTAEELSHSEARTTRENAELIDNAIAQIERLLGTGQGSVRGSA